MKVTQLIFSTLLALATLSSCDDTRNTNNSEDIVQPLVDSQSLKDIYPLINEESHQSEFSLVFSDEFNDSEIDTSKWNVQDKFYKDRIDFNLYADGNQIEEKEGHLFIYYLKDSTKEDTYYAGRVDSRGKYAPTYGFFEAKMHFVKPNGHQTAFWMMPEGKGMSVPDGVDSTANSGAEIDIIEGNKTHTYSCGLHWDGYGAAHKTNGQEIEVNEFHNQEYHIMGFEWDVHYLRWYLDGNVVREIADSTLIPRVPHFLYFSGSMWSNHDWVDGNMLDNEFIQGGGIDKAYVDYIRVYQKVTK